MRYCVAVVLAWIAYGFFGLAWAGDGGKRTGAIAPSDGCAAPPCCVDNYVKKPLPCVACPNVCRACDVYCKKPLPCVPSVATCGCPDHYCKKPVPCPCLNRPWQFYRCPPCECPSEVEPRTTPTRPGR